jgi:hypothetical protein
VTRHRLSLRGRPEQGGGHVALLSEPEEEPALEGELILGLVRGGDLHDPLGAAFLPQEIVPVPLAWWPRRALGVSGGRFPVRKDARHLHV